MMFVTVVLNLLGIAAAIRVPVSWPEHEKNFKIIYKTQTAKVSPSNYREFYIPRQEYGAYWLQSRKKVPRFDPEFTLAAAGKKRYIKSPHLGIIYVPNAKENQVKQKKQIFSQPIYVPDTFENGWVPISKPRNQVNQPSQTRIVPAYNFNNYIRASRKNDRVEDIDLINKHGDQNSPLQIVPAGEKTDEAEDMEPMDEHREIPVAKYEEEKEVATRVIYPGEGLWAIPGIKHQPYVRKKDYLSQPDKQEEEKPEGYETFEALAPKFLQQSEKFNEKLQSRFEQNEREDQEDHADQTEEIEDDEEDEEAFVPTKLLAQVRKTENTEHLPPSVEDPRLKEVIKDSKIHTVYTEEGYEDIEYDHAGEEKNAEDSEGHVDPSQKNVRVKLKYPKFNKNLIDGVDILKEFENYKDPTLKEFEGDSDSSASSYNNPNMTETKKLIMVEIKDMDNGDKKMAVRILTKPYEENITKEFVKIIPRVQRQKRSTNTEKYPYYNKDPRILNKNSPLRYAEDMQTIPQKVEGEMSFYEQSGAANCPEIPRDIDPIPKNLKNIEAGIPQTGPNNEPVTRRLENLGDKIDCLKVKYFGENPLDSPFFKEDSIEAPEPIFEDLKATTKNRIAKSAASEENEVAPEKAALTVIKRRRKRPQRPSLPPFETNRFLPAPLLPVINIYPTTTAIPKYKVLSEVYYKDEIKPNEQLNVFADVINNIKTAIPALTSSERPEYAGNVEKRKSSYNSKISKLRTTTALPPNYLDNHKPMYDDYLATLKTSETSLIPSISSSYINPAVKSYIYKGVLPAKDFLPTETTIINVVGMSPPFSINTPARYSHLGNLEPTTLNTFSVPGMKPPANNKPMVYSDFKNFLSNRVRRRNNYHKIHKRSANRPMYSEIRRSKSDAPKDEEEDAEDYTPRRNRNFHYDVENDRVVYTKSQAEEEAPVELLEVEEETITTTPKPQIAVVTEINGPSFLDYIEKIRGDSNYRLILEPKPIEKLKPNKAPTTQKTVPTGTPEFLVFVQKIKTDDDYRPIKETKLKTPALEPVKEEPSREIIEEPPKPVQNFNSYKSGQIFDITEYLPQPKIEIDYSKYKTIERAPVSRSPEELEDGLVQASARADIAQEESGESVIVSSTSESPKIQTILRNRIRKRPSTTTETLSSVTLTTEAPKRIRKRLKLTNTTEPALEVEDSQTQRVVRRKLVSKSNQEVPHNHKAIYSPITTDEENQKVRPNKDVQVFKKYDSDKRHGGNYRRKSESAQESSSTTESSRLSDIVHKPFAYYTDPTLPASVNRLKETKTITLQADPEFSPDIETKVDGEDDLNSKDKGDTTTESSPHIIKDPSKRLYFYAPV